MILTARYLRVTYPALFGGLFTILDTPEGIDCVYVDGRRRLFRVNPHFDILKEFELLERREAAQ